MGIGLLLFADIADVDRRFQVAFEILDNDSDRSAREAQALRRTGVLAGESAAATLPTSLPTFRAVSDSALCRQNKGELYENRSRSSILTNPKSVADYTVGCSEGMSSTLVGFAELPKVTLLAFKTLSDARRKVFEAFGNIWKL